MASAQLVLTPSPVSVANGFNQTFTLTLPYAAPIGGLTAPDLVSSVPSVASVPATLSVPQYATSATFQLAATALGNTVITANDPDSSVAVAQVSVITPPSLTIAPNQVDPWGRAHLRYHDSIQHARAGGWFRHGIVQ